MIFLTYLIQSQVWAKYILHVISHLSGSHHVNAAFLFHLTFDYWTNVRVDEASLYSWFTLWVIKKSNSGSLTLLVLQQTKFPRIFSSEYRDLHQMFIFLSDHHIQCFNLLTVQKQNGSHSGSTHVYFRYITVWELFIWWPPNQITSCL